ncbi:MAG: NUDIX domain-containing protein [Anaerolineales bacterium]|nr:NUDIX domain-containing protein [Anaerolineales bacterium]
MTNPQPQVQTVDGKRSFTCFPVAILVFIINEQEEFLLLSHPERGGKWEVVSGGLESNETLLEGALRETREEAGSSIRVRPLGTVHAFTFHYDEDVRFTLSISYLMAYEGGEIQPGGDMEGSSYRWFSLEDLSFEDIELILPVRKWITQRAIELYRLFKQQRIDLEPSLPME